jgi:TDG/mug DNA glycosylase family protein
MDEFTTLMDYLEEGLDIVFVGLNPSTYSVQLGHYFANPRNRFWAALNRSGLVDRDLAPADDARLRDYRIGFTDVVKRPTPQASHLRADDYRYWSPILRDKLLEYQPRIACFHGVTGYNAYLKYAEGVNQKSQLGLQERRIGNSAVFVTPNPSPANAQYSLDDLVHWYQRLNDLRRKLTE